MTDNSNLEFEYCRELALLPGSVFEFTSRFVPESQMEPLLPIYALKQAIGGIPQSQTDDSVKWAKLKWWSEELSADPGSSSRHPVLRALWLSGARLCLDDSLLLRLVRDALLQIDTAPDGDEQSLFERLSELGDTDIQLELALNKAAIDVKCQKFLAAASCCYGFISSFSSGQLSQAPRLPLSLLAKHGVSSTQLAQGEGASELTQIISRLTEDALGWFDKGLSGLSKDATPTVGKHLRLRWVMEYRRLESIRQDVPAFLAKGKRFGPADAWYAWRFVRKAG